MPVDPGKWLSNRDDGSTARGSKKPLIVFRVPSREGFIDEADPVEKV
jgi:hypothetical protein